MIVALNDLAKVRKRHQGKRIVLTSGTFDLLHVGHLNYLKAVKKYGDIVVVLMSGDTRVRARKGLKRPIIPEDERAQILDALKMIDYVILDPGKPDTDPLYTEIVAGLQPDFYVTDGEDPRFWSIIEPSKLAVLGRVQSGKYASTSAIIDHIRTS